MKRFTNVQRRLRRYARMSGDDAIRHGRMIRSCDAQARDWSEIAAGVQRRVAAGLEKDGDDAVRHAEDRAAYFRGIADKEQERQYRSAIQAFHFAAESLN